MKVDSKYLMPFLDVIKGILTDLQYGFAECEDLEQCRDTLDYSTDQIKTVITTFVNDHLTPPAVISTAKKVPAFVKIHDNLLEHPPGDRDQTPGESRAVFMTQFYFYMKRKFENHPIDQVPTDKLYYYILNNLAMSDAKYGEFFFNRLESAATEVIVKLTDEIIDERIKYPQLSLVLSSADQVKTKKTLLDIL